MLLVSGGKDELLAQADRFLDQGRMAEARDLYQCVAGMAPSDTETWLMLAAIEAELGNVEAALLACTTVLSVDAASADAYAMRGRLQAVMGQPGTAMLALEQAVALKPDDGEAWNALAGVLLQQAHFEDAVRCAGEGVRLLPQHAEGFINLGNALAALDRVPEAREACQQAVAMDAKNGLAWGCLARVCEREAAWAEARAAYQKMIQFLPVHPAGRVGLARVHLALEECEQARSVLETAQSVRPDDPEINQGFAKLYSAQGEALLAETYFRKALASNPRSITLLVDMANFLQDQNRHDEAEVHYQRALEVSPENPDAHYNLGVCRQRQARHQEAIACFDRAIAARPDFVEAHWSCAFHLLLLGDYARGWPEYEWRLKQKHNVQRPFTQPVWEGDDLTGLTLLVHDEQGYGDTFQFVRYLQLVKARGGRVVLECHDKLAPILRGCEGYDELHERPSPAHVPATHFDTHIHLLSLPLLFQTQQDNIPHQVPYIKADAERVLQWRERLSADPYFKIGIAWAGSANHTNEVQRSCALESFRPIFELADVSVYCLQKGPGVEQADHSPAGMNIRRVDRELDLTERFVDTAALMVNLDLVITIDTSIAHLAGALGRPVWTLLCSRPDWRWGLEGASSPWYPTMRLFRQAHAGDWAQVMIEVSAALKSLTMKRD